MGRKQVTVEKRDETFTDRTITKIWQELPCPNNPYLAENCLCHGYDLLELMQKRSFVDVFYLLFSGELPTLEQATLLETLMVALINPGPRHPATRASMNAAVSRTNTAHLLPISLSVLSGQHLGGEEVVSAMQFLNESKSVPPEEVFNKLYNGTQPPEQGDWHVAPGFGNRFGGIDPMPQRVAAHLSDLPGGGSVIKWGHDFSKALIPHQMGWLSTGLAAAVFCDLSLHPRAGAGLFQLLCAPGLLAHGLELAGSPLTAMPFLDKEHYIIDEKAKTRKV